MTASHLARAVVSRLGQSALVLFVALPLPPLTAAQDNSRPVTVSDRDLSDNDRAEIQDLVARYARAIGACAAEDYADLFVAPEGFFESVSRGRVVGRARLIPLVKSEPQCYQEPSARAVREVPIVEITVTPHGVTGRAPLAAGGHYEDVYVKTAKGWRFKSRNNVTKASESANMSRDDFAQLHDLAGDRDQFEDVYLSTPNGMLFRSAGMTIEPVAPGRAKARIHLKNDPGRYEDVYVRTANGWRFESRQYVPVDDVAPFSGRR